MTHVTSDFRIEQHRADAYVLSIHGELDLYTAPQAKALLDDAVAAGEHAIVLDLEDTTFVDSSAMAVIVATLKAAADDVARSAR